MLVEKSWGIYMTSSWVGFRLCVLRIFILFFVYNTHTHTTAKCHRFYLIKSCDCVVVVVVVGMSYPFFEKYIFFRAKRQEGRNRKSRVTCREEKNRMKDSLYGVAWHSCRLLRRIESPCPYRIISGVELGLLFQAENPRAPS